MPAQAFTSNSGYFQKLEFVSETLIPGPGLSSLSLCYVTRDLLIMGHTLTSDIQGYALSSDGCNQQLERHFSPEQIVTAQSDRMNLIDPAIPPVARNSLERNIRNYGLWLGVALALLAVILRRIKSLMGLDPRGPLRRKAAQRILTTMCHVAKCDGLVDAREMKLIARTARRLTGRVYPTSDVIRLADHLEIELTPHDFIGFGKGLRDREKDTMMQAVLFIAIADGKMLKSEYNFATELAHGLGMPGEDFRRVLNVALADLDTHIAA
ncbi:TerB family tellurite resistance protein [Loktanella agnita]